jgi:hypothetical protein
MNPSQAKSKIDYSRAPARRKRGSPTKMFQLYAFAGHR